MSQIPQRTTMKHLISCPYGAHSQMRVTDGSNHHMSYSEITDVISVTKESYRVPSEFKSTIMTQLEMSRTAKETRRELRSQAGGGIM